jgi:DUF4097 and DUF4098 domain-containing protein YvlB
MVIAGIALALTLAQTVGPHQEAPRTDETVPVQRGARLAINNYAGEVMVHAWDKDAIHVVARHQSRMHVTINTNGATVQIGSSGSNGPRGSVDYDISAPAWLPIRVEGTYDFVTIDGMQSEVSATTLRGDVVIKGGNGVVTAKSIEGEIDVDGARGKITVSSVQEKIKINNTSGEVTAESTNGSITMLGMEASSVDASTVNGDIVYEGKIADSGHYSFDTHNGSLSLGLPEDVNATFSIRTYQGSFSTDLPLQGVSNRELQRGRRVTSTLGNGSADITLETFGGSIRLRRGTAYRRHER